MNTKKELKKISAELLKEWDYDKNVEKPTNYSAGSNAKVWWTCEKGHSWQASIANRALHNRGYFISDTRTQMSSIK